MNLRNRRRSKSKKNSRFSNPPEKKSIQDLKKEGMLIRKAMREFRKKVNRRKIKNRKMEQILEGISSGLQKKVSDFRKTEKIKEIESNKSKSQFLWLELQNTKFFL